jgi:hypothetical protein
MNIERLIRNLFYIFGSWALISAIYIFARVIASQNTNRNSLTNRWLSLKTGFIKLAILIGAVVYLAILDEDRWLIDWLLPHDSSVVLERFVQAVIVFIIPAALGIYHGLTIPDEKADGKENR